MNLAHAPQFPGSRRSPAPRTLVDVLQDTAQRHPEALALDDGTHTMSYSELLAALDQIAGRLAEAGVGPGDAVGIRVPSGGCDLYLGILGIMTAGAAYVPVDVDDPEERASLVFSEAGVAATVTARPSPDAAPGSTLQIEASARIADRERPEPRAVLPGDDCWVIFTSGSTGTPKGVAVTHRSAAAFVDAEARIFLQDEPLGAGDRVLAGLSVAFDASCEEMWLAWRHGACLVPAPRSLVKSGMDLGPWLSTRGITVVSTVPTLAALWPPETLDNVRLLIFGGEACPPELAERLVDPEREVWNTYGPTEATVVACGQKLDGHPPIRIGLPLDGWDLAVVDKAGVPVAEGEVGELIIGGVGLARYLDPAKDAEKYAPMPTLGWGRAYRSGDLVTNDARGLLFNGRADEQVKLGGRRIELGEVDAALQSLPGVSGAAAAVKSTGGSDRLVGYLVPADPDSFDADDARDQLLSALPPTLVPLLAVVDELPTKTSGKVDRAALPWPLGGEEDAPESAIQTDELGAWVIDQWRAVLGTAPARLESEFFRAGGGSLAAAQLVTRLRSRMPTITVGDLYAHPSLSALIDAAHAAAAEDTVAVEPRTVGRTARGAQVAQTLLGIPLHILAAMRWLTMLAALSTAFADLGILDGAPRTPWWVIAIMWFVFLSPWGRLLLAAGAARLLLRGIEPGTYQRSGSVHLRLWFAEHISDLAAAVSIGSAPWISWYARLLGAKIGKNVDLHSVPPVTGMLTLSSGAAVEPEVDLSGYWIDGDKLHIGAIKIGKYASVGARSTLLPGTRIGAGASVAPGSAVSGSLRREGQYSGSPARRSGKTLEVWPDPPEQRRHMPFLLYAAGSLSMAGIPYLAAVPALAVLAALLQATGAGGTLSGQALLVLALSPIAAALWFVGTAALILGSVRFLGTGITEGYHPVRSVTGWRVWATERVLDMARDLLFPIYASLFTPVWLRMLGAKVGTGVEASTVLLVPSMTTIGDGAFLADDTMVASYEMGHGWMRIGPAKVGRRAFLGNSGIAGPGRRVPRNSLVAVLSAAPAKAKKGSSWLGSPPVRLRRTQVEGDDERTYHPTSKLRRARAGWEAMRAVPVVISVAIAAGVLLALDALLALGGYPLAIALGGLVMMAAGAVAAGSSVLAKWLLVGPIRPGNHQLWSSFVWRNEVVDTFVELVSAPWFARTASGTPALVWWLRALGAKIGHGVWCESYWLPEADLVTLGDSSTVNRGCVVQTHLFHDRVMSLDTVTFEPGATLGPNGVVLPAAGIGAGATVGPGSLVMRGEFVPPSTVWAGNPVGPWKIPPATGA